MHNYLYERLRAYVYAECNAAGPSGDGRGYFIEKTGADIGSVDDVVGDRSRMFLDELAHTLLATIEHAQGAGDIAVFRGRG